MKLQENEIRKAVSYARVAFTGEQGQRGSVQTQLEALREYARERGYEIVREFVDEGKSGSTINRPGLKDMLALIAENPKAVDAILVWNRSRLSRNSSTTFAIKESLCGVDVVSVNEPVDDLLPAGLLLRDMLVTILASMSEELVRGMKANAQRGGWNGGKPPLGYKTARIQVGNEERTTLIIDEEYGPVIARIFHMYLEGNGIPEIVRTLNCEDIRTRTGDLWQPRTVRCILTNEVYAGTLSWNKTHEKDGRRTDSDADQIVRTRDHHPAIVDADVFELVKREMRRTEE